MQKVIDYVKQYIGVISIVLALSILLTYSLSYFMVNTGNKRAAEMYVGELKYSISIDYDDINTIAIEPNSIKYIDLAIEDQNEINNYYKLLYKNNSNIKVEYFTTVPSADGSNYGYNEPNGLINSKTFIGTKLRITNNSSSEQTVTFTVTGGYSTNTLDDVDVPSGYTNVNIEGTLELNEFHCVIPGVTKLTSGETYTLSDYTYKYKNKGTSTSGDSLKWKSTSEDGWGVQLTDKTSTNEVTSSVCTYINNKPVLYMNNMFLKSQATSISLKFNTSKVTDMSSMFYNTQVTSLDLSSFDTSNVTDMTGMFKDSVLTSIKGLNGFDTSNVTNMGSMFWNTQLTTLDLSNFNTSKVTNMTSMFGSYTNSKLTNINVSSFDTSKVTDMSDMFYGVLASELDLSSFNTSKVTRMDSMFRQSKVLTIKGLEKFDTSNVTEMTLMFYRCLMDTLDLSSFDTSKVTSMYGMFEEMYNIKTIYVSSKFVTTSVTEGTDMFLYSSNLVGENGTKYNSSYVDKTYARIDTASNPGYFTNLEPISFSTDSWKTIINAVKNNNTSKYNIGDTKTVQIGNLGTHTLRIANKITTNSCTSSTYSETACGFVLEFEDVILAKEINNTASNVNGWPATELHYYLNNEFYSMIPTELKNGIIQTRVISGYGQSGSSNFTSTDYIYIPSLAEVYADVTTASDTAKDLTRQLDYYSFKGAVTTNASATIKKLGNSTNVWWLRTPDRTSTSAYYAVDTTGKSIVSTATLGNIGFSPAFRIG